ncbi:MAG: trypsin-like peptidase domain-containing protein [Nitrospirae bacterium]|nr:trypsin-like peptidase domain-containing protein [Nitrospirota bacterium]
MKKAVLVLLLLGTPHPGLRTLAEAAEVNLYRRDAVVEVVQKASAAVVNINTETRTQERQGAPFGFQDPFFDEFFKDFFDMYSLPRERVYESLGSGAIIDPQGIILTNEHVVRLATKIKVTLVDGKEYLAEPVGADPDTDIAVLRVKTESGAIRLPTLGMGRSNDIMIGETVIAIGNPFGLSHTVTVGVVSALHRSVKTGDRVYQDFVQTDASINPGNSGGPLLNILGQTVGINTAIVAKAQGIGFAIPIDRANRIMSNLLTQGQVTIPWYGVRVQAINDELSNYFGVSRGVVVTKVEADSPADKAGLRRQDIITSLEDSPVQYREDFYSLLRGYRTGDTIRTEIFREGTKRVIPVVVTVFPNARAEDLGFEMLGFNVKAGPGRRVSISKVRPGSPAYQTGIRAGDILLRLDSRVLYSLDDFRETVLNMRGQASILAEIQRGNFIYRVVLDI